METMDHSDILTRTRAYIQENFLYMRPQFKLGDNDPLLQQGVIDSMGVMELIGFLKSEFGLVVPDDDITEEHFGSLNAIARYVATQRLRNEAA